MNGIPLNYDDAVKAGVEFDANLVCNLEEPGGVRFDAKSPGDLCYMGPCSGGYRTVCYKDANNACSNCGRTSYGC